MTRLHRILFDADPEGTLLGGGEPAAAPAAATPAAATPAAATPAAANNWIDLLPTEMKDNATLKKYTSVEALAGAYLNAQKLIGGNKIAVPTDATTDEEWTNIFRKLGSPEKLEDFKVEFKKEASISEDFSKEFAAQAHKLGVLPKQAKALAEWFSDLNIKSTTDAKASRETSFAKVKEDLQKEWGDAFGLQASRATKLLKEFMGDEGIKHFNNMGWGADAEAMKFLAKVASKMYKEDKTLGAEGTSLAKTPDEIKSEINSIMGDAKSPYFVKDHPKHKETVAKVQQMYEILYKAK